MTAGIIGGGAVCRIQINQRHHQRQTIGRQLTAKWVNIEEQRHVEMNILIGGSGQGRDSDETAENHLMSQQGLDDRHHGWIGIDARIVECPGDCDRDHVPSIPHMPGIGVQNVTMIGRIGLFIVCPQRTNMIGFQHLLEMHDTGLREPLTGTCQRNIGERAIL